MRFLSRCIRIYQYTLSPDHSWRRVRYPYGYCRYTPTCSDYMIAAVERHGTLRGAWSGAKRILRCNPWSRGGFDP